MRIVEVVPSLHVGGAERVVALLARGLQDLGHEVTVISLYAPAETWIEAELKAAGVSCRWLGKRPGLDLRIVPRLARELRALRPDVVHTHLHTVKYAWPAAALQRHRPALFHTIHNLALHEIEASGRALHQVAFRAGVAPIAIGEAVAESIRQVYRLEPRAIIPNGIPVASYAPQPGDGGRTGGAKDREAVRAELGIPADAPMLLAVGRLNVQKDHAGLLEAFATATAEGDAHLLIAGEGELRSALESQARALGIEGRVQLLGVRSDLRRLFAAADLFVLASRWEGNPLTVMEAMAAGKPVLATAVGCVPELVPAGAGWLVAPGDVGGLARGIATFLGDQEGARAMGQRGLEIAVARFDVAEMARRYGEVFGGPARGLRTHRRPNALE